MKRDIKNAVLPPILLTKPNDKYDIDVIDNESFEFPFDKKKNKLITSWKWGNIYRNKGDFTVTLFLSVLLRELKERYPFSINDMGKNQLRTMTMVRIDSRMKLAEVQCDKIQVYLNKKEK